jgi:hypothetical protein
MDIQTAEPLVPEPSLVEVKIAIGKLKTYKSPDTDQIPAEFIKAGRETLRTDIQTCLFYMEYGGIAIAAEGIYFCINS